MNDVSDALIERVLSKTKYLMFNASTRKSVIKYYREARIWLRVTSYIGLGMSKDVYDDIAKELKNYRVEALKRFEEED